MDFDDDEHGFGPGLPPSLVSLTPFAHSASSASRRLSSCFTQPNEPVRAKKQLAWVSLQGRLVGADEASSAKRIDPKGALSSEEAVAWELFTPIQRVLTVAVVAAAAGNSNKNKQISKLQKSVELRDQMLLSMQQKLDNLCEQVNYFKDQPEICDAFINKIVDCGCEQCQHHNPQNGSTLDSLAFEHDINRLRKECEQKDVTIKELSTFIHSSEVLGSKRTAELEDIVRRKNMIINKLRKDIIVLEQKVVNLSRLRRSSFSAASSNNPQRLPLMSENVLYNMDSTTDPSSSDSDSSPRNRTQALSVRTSEKALMGDLIREEVKSPTSTEENNSSRSTSPLKVNTFNHTPKTVQPLKPKRVGGENKSRRTQVKSKDVAVTKRWV